MKQMARLYSKKIEKAVEILKEISKNIDNSIKALEDTQKYVYYGLKLEKVSEVRRQLKEDISWLQKIRKELENLEAKDWVRREETIES